MQTEPAARTLAALPLRELLLDKEFWELAGNVATVVALVVGGIWTYRLFVQKRQRYPRALVSHRTHAWPLPDGRMLLRVSAVIKNQGDVLIRIVCGKVWVSAIRPFDAAEALLAGERHRLNRPGNEIAWPLAGECEWESGSEEIEPGEEDEIHFDFVLDRWSTLQVYTHLENETKKRRFKKDKVIGWNTTSIHELELGGGMTTRPYEAQQGTPKEKPPRLPEPERTTRQAPPKDKPDPIPPKKSPPRG